MDAVAVAAGTAALRQGSQTEPGTDPQHRHTLPAPQRVPQPAPARAGNALGLGPRDRRNLCLGGVPRRLRRALGLLGGVHPGAQRVGAILGPMCPALGGLGPGALGAAIRVRRVGPALGGPPVSLSCRGSGFRQTRAIALRISPFLRLVRPKPLKISRLLSAARPFLLALQSRVRGVMTGRLSGRSRARLHLRVVGHLHKRPAIVAGLGAPAETTCLQPHSLGGHAESLASLSVGQPVGHVVSRRLSGRLIGRLTGWSIGRSWTLPQHPTGLANLVVPRKVRLVRFVRIQGKARRNALGNAPNRHQRPIAVLPCLFLRLTARLEGRHIARPGAAAGARRLARDRGDQFAGSVAAMRSIVDDGATRPAGPPAESHDGPDTPARSAQAGISPSPPAAGRPNTPSVTLLRQRSAGSR
jgi:hypothetical protein